MLKMTNVVGKSGWFHHQCVFWYLAPENCGAGITVRGELHLYEARHRWAMTKTMAEVC